MSAHTMARQRAWTQTRTRGWVASAKVMLVMTSLRCINVATAYPFPPELAPHLRVLERRQEDHQQQNSTRNSDSNTLGNSISPRVWVPAVVVVLILLSIFCFIWTRTSVLSRIRRSVHNRTHATPASGTAASTREVTASQLTGSNNNSTTTNRTRFGNSTANGRTGTGRRNPRLGRRNGRTPSQISTHSLPVYMKEPGNQELVIFRGPDAMEMDMLGVDLQGTMIEEREANSSDDEDAEDRQEEGEPGGDEGTERERNTRASVLMLDVSRRLEHEGPRPDQSAMSFGLGGSGRDQEPGPDTSTTQLLRSRTNSGASARRTSSIPSEAPPDYESAIPLPSSPVSPSEEEREGAGRESTSTNATSSSQTQNQPPPGLSISETLRSPSGRRSRLASQVSRVSQLLHLGTTTTSNGAVTSPGIAAMAGSASADVGPQTAQTARNGISVGTPEPRRSSNSVLLSDSDVPPPSPLSPPRPSTGSRPATASQQNRHRHSNSSSSTLALPLSMPFRTLSRQRSSNSLAHPRSSADLRSSTSFSNLSNNNPASASTFSLAQSIAAGTTSISSPLSHTLTRTEISYPAGGPTPEQVKLLSSREGLRKFGVPYGDRAVEFARSHPRLDVNVDDPPPPDFESPTDGERPNAAVAAAAPSSSSTLSSNIGDTRSSAEEEGRRAEENEGDMDHDDGHGHGADVLSASSTLRGNANNSNGSTPSLSRERGADNSPAETRIIMPLFM